MTRMSSCGTLADPRLKALKRVMGRPDDRTEDKLLLHLGCLFILRSNRRHCLVC